LAANRARIFVGTFTREWKSGHATGDEPASTAEGVYQFQFDRSTGDFASCEVTRGLISPSWLALHPRLSILYALERQLELDNRAEGALSSYHIDEESGQLTCTSRQSSMGGGPCHVSVHPSGRHAFAANYRSGHLVAFPLDEFGRVEAVDRIIQHTGSSVHPRQNSARPHQVCPSANGQYVMVTDLGLDQILTYPTDPIDGALAGVPAHSVSFPPGTGPRHLAWHPSGKFVFASGELSSTLCVLELNDEDGRLRYLSSQSTLPAEYAGPPNAPGEVLVHPSGRIVYVSNRGHDSIAVFSFDEATGMANLLGTQHTQGERPHNFALDPAGAFLVVGNLTTGNLVRFHIDPDSMWPTSGNYRIDCPSPTCVIFWPTSHV
jgi:6-phosphogluconolactonase